VGPAVAAAASVLLAGCAAEPPAPDAEPPVVAAVVSESQERKILASVAATVAEHDDATAAEGLRARLTGPALSMRLAELRLAAATGDEGWRTDLSAQTQQVVLPSDQGWPRTSYAIQDQPDSGHAPALMVLDQRSAREQYRLWAYLSLAPGASLPPFAEPELGSAAVAPDDDTSLVRSPRAALAGYAEVLSEDAAAADAAAFEDDVLRRTMRDVERSQTSVPGWRTTEGTYSFSARVEPDTGLRTVRTADGGALVVGGLTSTQTIALGQEGAEIGTDALPAAQKALLGDQEATDRLRTRYVDLVALYVPAAGSERRITLLGFRHLPVDVSSG
jgi:hypothetical protein